MFAATARLACCEASSHAASTSFVARPSTAAIVPGRSSPAFCISSPRRRTSFAACGEPSADAVTYAEYSPSEWPAAATTPSTVSRTTAKTAALCARIAGWAFCVAVGSSSGPSNMMRDKGTSPPPRALRRSRRIPRAPPETAPPDLFPCRLFARLVPDRARSCLPPHDHAAPGEARTERAQHHDHARLQPAGFDGLVERDGDGRRRRVAKSVHVDVDLVHRDAGVLCRGFDDADVGLMGDEQIDIAGGHPRAFERVIAGVSHRQHRGLEDFAAGHLDVVAVIFEQLLTGRMRCAAAR